MSLNLDIDDNTTRRNSLAALRWDSAWIDPALRRMAERGAERAGLAVEVWMERAIRQACGMPAMPPIASAPRPMEAAPEQDFLASNFAPLPDESGGDIAEPSAVEPMIEEPAAPPMQPLDAALDSTEPEFHQQAFDDDGFAALGDAAHPTAPEPANVPALFADAAAFEAQDIPHRSAQTASWRQPPAAAGHSTRGSSVIWAAGIAAVLAFCAVVAVRDPNLLRGRLVADNNVAIPTQAPATAANAPLHVQPQARDRGVAIAMVPPPAVAEDARAPIASPKIELPPPAPVAVAPSPTPTQTTAAVSPAPTALPPPAVALAESKPVQMASLPTASDDRAATAPAAAVPPPAAAIEADRAAEPAPLQPTPVAKAHIRVAPPPPSRAMAERPTQLAMAPTSAAPPPASTRGTTADARAAADLATRVAAGDHVAEYRLGILYALGKGVPRDYEHAAKLLHASATAGLAEAQYDYGVLCDKGFGVPRDSAEAARWYAKAAEQGHPPAALNLGYAYAEGLGVARNLPEAARWFRRAAEAGLINAQFNLAYMFEQGAGVSKSMVDAYAWYSVAAEKGDQGAQAAVDRIALKLSPHELQFAKARIRAVKHVIRVQN